MSNFTPRLDKPKYGNKYYNRPLKGGYNPCIKGNYPYKATVRTGYSGLDVLPNCVGWATGRFAEIIGEPKCQYLGNTNAKNFYSLAIKQGLEVGTEPRLGACVVWTNEEYGHVAIVERIISEDVILISESGWDSKTPVWWATHRRGDGNWINGTDYTWMKKGNYKLLGFIYNPAVEEEEVKQEDFDRMMLVWLANQANRKAEGYAKDALQWAKDNGLMVGDLEGNQMPKSFIKREDFVTILKAYDEKVNKKTKKKSDAQV